MLTNSKMGGGKLSKAFTLIEIVSAIVIVGIIALITVPITIRLINEAKKKSFLITAEGIVRATSLSLADNEDIYEEYFINNDYITFKFSASEGKEGESIDEIGGKKVKLLFEGKSPVGGEVNLYKNGDVEVINLTDGHFYVNKDVDTELMVSDTSGTLTRNELQEELNKVKEQIQALQKSDKTNKEKSAELERQIQSIDVLSKTYPVGSIYISTSSSNPASIFGGTWESFGTGRTLVGVDTSNTNFNAVSKTGGLENNLLTIANLPSHNHTIPVLKGSSTSAGNHTHTRGTMEITGSIEPIGGGEPKLGFPTGAFYAYDRVTYYSSAPVVQSEFGRFDGFKFAASKSWTGETSLNGNHTHAITTEENKTNFEGSGKTFTNLQPYITVYMWKRVS